GLGPRRLRAGGRKRGRRHLLDLSKARVESKSQLVSANRRPKSGCRDEEFKKFCTVGQSVGRYPCGIAFAGASLGLFRHGSSGKGKTDSKQDRRRRKAGKQARHKCWGPGCRLFPRRQVAGVEFAGGPRAANLPQQRQLKLWDVETGKKLKTFQLDELASDLFFFDGGKKILADHRYGSFTLWDVASRDRIARYLR